MLINDPRSRTRRHPGELDPAMFGGKAMTYYGRWTYKYETAPGGAAGRDHPSQTGPAAIPTRCDHSWRQLTTCCATRTRSDFRRSPLMPSAGTSCSPAGPGFDALKERARTRESAGELERASASMCTMRGTRWNRTMSWPHPGKRRRAPLKRSCTARIGIISAASAAGRTESHQVFTAPRQMPSARPHAGAGGRSRRWRSRRRARCFPRDDRRAGFAGRPYSPATAVPAARHRADLNMDGQALGRTHDVEINGFGSPTWRARGPRPPRQAA